MKSHYVEINNLLFNYKNLFNKQTINTIRDIIF